MPRQRRDCQRAVRIDVVHARGKLDIDTVLRITAVLRKRRCRDGRSGGFLYELAADARKVADGLGVQAREARMGQRRLSENACFGSGPGWIGIRRRPAQDEGGYL